MGLISTANTITITAKLTKAGRERLIEESNTIISHFILGDSDANYKTNQTLGTGLIPVDSGDLGENGMVNNNIAEGINIKNTLYLSNTQKKLKSVEKGSYQLRGEVVNLGETIVSGSNLTFLTLDRTDTTNDETNYFKSLDLPITDERKTIFTAPSQKGGWLDTAFSGINTDNVLMVNIGKDTYGELIDGKSIKGVLPVATGFTSGGDVTGVTTYTIYSSFVNSSQFAKKVLDNQYKDKSVFTQGLFNGGMNVAYLVSDDVQKPNNDSSKSWSTGYDQFKPFSEKNKELINPVSVTETGINADKVIGIAYLDKGLLAITDPTLVSGVTEAFNFSGDSETNTITNPLGFTYMTGSSYNLTIDSCLNNLVQNIVCIAGRDEFYKTDNDTWDESDDIRISEIGITDLTGQLLAIGKPDRHIIKKKNDFVIFDVQIVI
jgi:hypothetical protein